MKIIIYSKLEKVQEEQFQQQILKMTTGMFASGLKQNILGQQGRTSFLKN